MSREGNLKGAERELVVSLDLMRRGFEVFRPTHAASCDLIALKNGIALRIEVKGCRNRQASGPVTALGKSGGSEPDARLFDILVQVADDLPLRYRRSIFHTINEASAELPLLETPSIHATHKNLRRAQQMEN